MGDRRYETGVEPISTRCFSDYRHRSLTRLSNKTMTKFNFKQTNYLKTFSDVVNPVYARPCSVFFISP